MESNKNAPIWLFWVLLSALGGAITGWLEAGRFQFGATLILAGFIVGGLQWFVLRKRLAWAWLWPVVTGFGLILGHLAHIYLAVDSAWAMWLWRHVGLWEVFWLNLFMFAIAVTVMSCAQWILLRQYPGSWAWIPLGTLAGAALGATSATTCNLACDVIAVNLGGAFSGAMVTASGWAIYGVITGWLLSRFNFSER